MLEDSPTDSTTRSGWNWWLICFVVATAMVGFLTTGRTRLLIRNSLFLATWTALISLPVGTTLAWLLCRTNVYGKRLGWATVTLSLFVPLYLHVAGWDSGFGQQGWIDYAAGQQSVPILAGWRGAIWVHAMAAVPWVTMIIAVSLRSMVPEWEESAMLDTTTFHIFRTITLPQLAPSMVVAAIWVLIVTTGEITITDVYQVRTYAEELYVGFARDLIRPDGELLELQTGPVAGSLLIGWLTLGALTACAWVWPVDRPVSVREQKTIELTKGKWVAFAFLVFVALLLIAIPVGNLFYKLGIVVEQVGESRVRSWSLAKAFKLMLDTPGSYTQEVAWSFALSQAMALATLLISIPFAWLASQNGFWRRALFAVAAFCFAIPGPIVAIVLIRLFSQSDIGWVQELYDRTIAAPAMALVIRGLPFIMLILWQAFRTIPNADFENARLAGASGIQQLLRIAIPQRYAAIGCAWFVAVALSMGELTSSILVVPPGVTTLSIRIFGLVHYGVEDRLAALCIWTMFLFAGLALLVYVLGARWSRRVTYNGR